MRLPIAALLLLIGAFIGWGVAHRVGDPALNPRGPAPDVATIASVSLRSVHAQARLTSFVARFVVVVTSEHRTMGLPQTKTMIVPGLIRYELDWGRLHEADLKWNAAERTLLVEAPAIELAGPEIELTHITEYAQGKLLMALTGSEPTLDAANRSRVAGQMQSEAREPTLMALARDSTRVAVARSFALPLAAAGITAKIVVRFPGEGMRREG
jgi:hypothetical protein